MPCVQGQALSSRVLLLLQLLKYSETTTQGKGHVLNMDNFIDTTNIEGRFEFSEWVRAYGKYLDEQLEVYQRINFYQVSTPAQLVMHASSAEILVKHMSKVHTFSCGDRNP